MPCRPLPEPLRLAAQEAAALAELSDELQAVIAQLVMLADDPPMELVMKGQAADLFGQRLMGLAAFLDALADVAPDGARIDAGRAARRLNLADQARRLSGAPPAPATASSGDLFLFED